MREVQVISVGKIVLLALSLNLFALAPGARAQTGDPISLGLTIFGMRVPTQMQMRDPIVTSDSPEYCGVLLHRIASLSRNPAIPPPVEAVALSEQGERMCGHGQTRAGIMRLRRALALMRRGEE